MWPADIDQDGASELIVSRREEAVATATQLMIIDEPYRRTGKRSPLMWEEEGHVALLGTVQHGGHDGLVLASFDTSIVSLGSSLLSGRLPLRVVLLEGVSPRRAHTLELRAEVDVRAGRMAGAMPVISVDFDEDGAQDLLHLGERGKAAIHLRRAGGFVDEPSVVLPAPPFQRVIALPANHSVLLLAAAEKDATLLSFVRLPLRDEAATTRATSPDARR